MKQFDKTVENLEIRKKFVDFRNTNVEQNSFHIQTKYFDIINNQNIDVIYDLVSNYEKVNESFLRILFISLKFLLLNISSSVSQIDRQHLNVLNNFEYNKIIMKKFKVVQELTSFRKYLKVIQRFICFVFRVLKSNHFVDIYKTDEDIDSIFSEIQSMKLKIDESSDEVLDLITKRSILLNKDFIFKRYNSIYNKNDQIEENNNNSSSDFDSKLDSINERSNIERNFDEKNDEDISNISNEYNKELLNNLESLLLRLNISFIKQSIRFNSFESLINIFFACLSVDNNNKSIKLTLIPVDIYRRYHSIFRNAGRIYHMIFRASVKLYFSANIYLKYSDKLEISFFNRTKNSLFNDEKILKIA